MGEKFLKIKREKRRVRVLKSLLYGGSVGLLCAGLFLLLSKTKMLSPSPIFSIPVGLAAGILACFAFYFLFRKSDLALAKELDRQFGLDERVETMLAYQAEEGVLPALQREDAERALAALPVKKIAPRRWWLSALSVSLGAAMLLSAILVPNQRNQTPPEKVIPFALSALQRAGMQGLIQDVKTSQMQEPYRGEISTELEELLETLEGTQTQTAMQSALGESMAYILATTCASSATAEIANALWETDDDYAKALARVIDTSRWQEPSWGDYAEKYALFRALYAHTAVEGEPTPDEQTLHLALKWKLENSAMKMAGALQNSAIEAGDALYTAIDNLLYRNYDDETGPVLGLSALAEYMTEISYAEAEGSLSRGFDAAAEDIYAAVSVQKINTNVGEGAMVKLSNLFLVPLPAFERPTLLESGSGSDSDGKEDGNGGGNGGGVGGGAAYGSDDYVLDPSTGEYVKYGELLAKYYALMSAKLENGSYTDAQKEAIKKYFDLLYSGLNKEGS